MPEPETITSQYTAPTSSSSGETGPYGTEMSIEDRSVDLDVSQYKDPDQWYGIKSWGSYRSR